MKIPFLSRKKKEIGIAADFILPSGKKISKFITPDNKEVFNYEGGTYNMRKEQRLLTADNVPLWIYIYNCSEPLDFSDVKGKAEIKVSAKGLKAILTKKLFYDLFRSYDEKKVLDIIFDILLIANLVMNIAIFLVVTGVHTKLFGGD